ncbi:MAG: PAS domain-containing protein [Phycisphaerae bacterium]|nr:PAS domain-containing protein [Phycisphaerae bacterium]
MTAKSGPIRRATRTLIGTRHMVAIFSVLFLLIIGMAGMLIYQDAYVMRDLINEEFNKQQLILARQAAAQIARMLDRIEVELVELKRFLAIMPASSREEGLRAALERSRTRGLIEMGLTDSAGRIVHALRAKGIAPITSEQIRSDCRDGAGGHMVLGPLRCEQNESGEPIVTSMVCTPVRLGDEDGTLFARVDVSDLVADVTKDIRSGRTGYAWVIDDAGTFLFHPESEFIGKNAFEVRKERQPYISFKEINRIMKEQMLHGQEDTGIYVSGWHRGTRGEITKLIAFTPVRGETLSAGGHMWSVAVVAPVGEVAEAVGPMYLRHFAAGGAIVLGLMIFGLLVAMYQYRISQALQQKVAQTEATLHEAERIYRRVVEQATDLIYIFDLQMRVVLLNPQTVELFSHLVITKKAGGVLPDDTDLKLESVWLGRRLGEMMRPRDAQFMARRISEVLETEHSISYEHTITVDGRKTRLSTKLVPIRDEEQEIRYLLGISRDVTEQAEMDQRIYNTEKLASIGTLAAGVAHEINNPLAVILGFTDLLLDRFEAGAPEYEDLKVIETNANNAKKIVENMLTFARVTEGLEDTLDVKGAVETVLRVAANTLMTKKIEMVTDLPDGLPRVRGDSREYQQVIFNLINNAVAAMESTGGKLSIGATAAEGWVHLSVADTGTGVPDRIKALIFDPFFTTKRVGEGTGLGLSLCYGIVKKYGGKMSFTSVSAEDSPGRPTGTTFTVSMPVDRPRDAAEGEA